MWIVCIIIKIVMKSRTCNQTRAPSCEGGENHGRIKTLTAGDWAYTEPSIPDSWWIWEILETEQAISKLSSTSSLKQG